MADIFIGLWRKMQIVSWMGRRRGDITPVGRRVFNIDLLIGLISH